MLSVALRKQQQDCHLLRDRNYVLFISCFLGVRWGEGLDISGRGKMVKKNLSKDIWRWILIIGDLSFCADRTRDKGRMCLALNISKANHIGMVWHGMVLCGVCVGGRAWLTFNSCLCRSGAVEKLFFFVCIYIYI